LSIRIFDSHAHYDDDAFDSDRLSVLESLSSAGVIGVINPGCSVKSSEQAVALAQKYPFIYAAAGIHPQDTPTANVGDINTIGEIAHRRKVIAIGEIGLDYNYENCPIDNQLKFFELQLQLAAELKLPVIIHDRDAHADTMELIKKYKPKGVMHCYSGSVEMANELLKLGFYLGFTGVVTFKNAKRAAEVIQALPMDKILAETDCPYMAPEPFRGKRCDSSMILHIINRMAQIKNMDAEEMAEQIIKNTQECFNISSVS
jgi:TatD DNase family protein